MSNELMMDSGPGKLKFAIMGGVALAFALTIAILMRPGKNEHVAVKPAAAQAVATQPAPAPAATPAAIPASQPPSSASTAAEQQATTLASAPQAVAEDVPSSAATNASPAPEASEDWNAASADDDGVDVPDTEVAAQAPVSQPRPAVRPPPPALDALQQWWREPATQQGFNVQYVGQAASEKALVFRFSKNLAGAQAAAQHIRVTDDKGEAANGIWAVGNNPYVLVYQGVPAGRYLVSIDPALASASGAKLGTPLYGAVYVN